jgi:N utilization substance protein A
MRLMCSAKLMAQQEEDVDLDEFSDEIESWVIDELKRIGLDTAKSVLALNKEELVRRTDLEEETVETVHHILKKEFETVRVMNL